MKKLSECKENDKVLIVKIEGSGEFKKRLLEMGFMRGIEVTVVKYAPLRDPMELFVRDFHVSLRVAEAAMVTVAEP
ncbi:MAG: FeoA family protein [Chitinivibrionales bacterium]|nr:FeoA family protein [Chitinivibrionales bacterium]